MNVIELTNEEYDIINECRYEIALSIVNEINLKSERFTTKNFGIEFKLLIDKFKSELKICKKAIKEGDNKTAKDSIKKLNHMLDNMSSKVDNAPEDDLYALNTSIKSIGSMIILNLAQIIGLKINSNILDNEFKNIMNNLKKATTLPEINDNSIEFGKSVGKSTNRSNSIRLGYVIIGIIVLIGSIIKIDSVDKISMKKKISKFKAELNKLSSKLS